MLFVGTVRDVNDGRPVNGMEYTAYRSMAERELADIAREAASDSAPTTSSSSTDSACSSSATRASSIAVAHPHRGAAYDASRYVIEQLKQRVPIWKLEQYVDGTREWVRTREAGEAGREDLRTTETSR